MSNDGKQCLGLHMRGADMSDGGKPAFCDWTVFRSGYEQADMSGGGKSALHNRTVFRSRHEGADMSDGGKPV